MRAASFRRLLGGTLTGTNLRIDRSPREVAQSARGADESAAASVAHPRHPALYSNPAAVPEAEDP